MLKKTYAVLAGFFAMLLASVNAFADPLIDSTMMTGIQTDALTDIATVGATILLIMGGLLGLFFAIRTMRKSGA